MTSNFAARVALSMFLMIFGAVFFVAGIAALLDLIGPQVVVILGNDAIDFRVDASWTYAGVVSAGLGYSLWNKTVPASMTSSTRRPDAPRMGRYDSWS